MSQRSPSNGLDLFALGRQLQQAGWDAMVSELIGEVAARREHLPDRSVWSLLIDRSGRWRFTATHQLDLTTALDPSHSGQPFHLTKETRQVLTVTGALNSSDNLPALLAELTQLAHEETHQHSVKTEGESPWREDHAQPAELSNL